MTSRFQFRRANASAWASANPILAAGELGFELDTRRFKIGDGSTAWNSLNYANAGSGGTGGSGIAGATPPVTFNELTELVALSYGTGLTTVNDVLVADFGTVSGKVTEGNDSRLSDARFPTAHKTTHALNGSDPLSAADIGAIGTAAIGTTVASLTGGKIPTNQLPAIAITDVFVVASQAAMLAVTAETGDVAIRTDTSQTFILASDDPTTLSNWKELRVNTSEYVTVTGTQTLSNKTLNLGSNTVTGNHAQFNTALSDQDFASLAGTETLSNKTFIAPVLGSATATSLSASENLTSTGTVSGTLLNSTGNITASGSISTTTGTISGALLNSTGNVVAAGNITTNNGLITTTLGTVSGTVITGGSINSTGNVVAAGSIITTAGAITTTTGTVSGTVITAGSLNSTGNVVARGTISGTVVSVTGEATVGGSLTVTSTISGSGLAGTLLSSATPLVSSGAGSAGASAIPSRQDHSHPAMSGTALTGGTLASNITVSSLTSFGTSPTFAGTFTATAGTITGSLGVGGSVTTGTISAAALGGSLVTNVTPSPLGTASPGSLTVPARADHIHTSSGLSTSLPISFVKTGVLTTGNGTLRWYNDLGAKTIDTVRASVGVAPTGSSIIVDVNVNGISIFSSRPTITASTFTTTTSTKTSTPYTIANGSYITVDIDQIGSTIAGSDLTVTLTLI